MDELVKGILFMGGLSIPVQALAILRMRDDISKGYKELAERHGKEVASLLSLLVYIGFAFVPPYLEHRDPSHFTYVEPFHSLYALCKFLIPVDPTHGELVPMYRWVWWLLTFTIPCLIYTGFNTVLAIAYWRTTR